MKRCPECRRDYYDDTLLYCLDDGNALLEGPATASGDEPATAILSEPGAIATGFPSGEAKTAIYRNTNDFEIENSKSIAVLPFANMSNDAENEYFCDGLAEELLNALAKINDLKVAARTSAFSFKGKNINANEIGRTLGVNTILEGSVRKSGNRLRITIQLVNTADGYHLWSERYDRAMRDIFDVQDEITLAVVDALKVKLLGEEKAAVLKRYTDNTQAYQLYLKGRYYLNKWTTDGLKKAIECFNRTIELEPQFAPAYSGLADCYASLSGELLWMSPKEAFPLARSAALKAIEIDDTLSEAHSSLALVKLNFDWDWVGAETELKRSIELNAKYVAAHHWYSHYLIVMGRMEESLAISKRAIELDPLELEINSHLAWHYCHARQPDQAIEQCQKTIEMELNFHEAHWFLGWAYEQKTMYEEAITAFQKAFACSGSSRMLAELGHAYGLARKTAEAEKVLNELKELSKQHYASPYNLALVYTGLGDKDQAFEWLNEACEDRSGWMIYLKTQHSFDSLHADPRFQEILRRVGLPQ
jgi:adenylate cyclase